MPGNVVEIELVQKDEGVFFHSFFCYLKPSIDGFLNGCRPYLSIDSTALNGRWNGHLFSAMALDGHNWMYPVAFGFFDGETTENWTWFMRQLQKAIGNPPHLAISSDAAKSIANAIQEVYPWAEHRECCIHLMKNFRKRFQGPAFGRMYPAARTFQPQYYEAEVTEVTPKHKIIRHVVNLKSHECTCREWQVSGKPCPHALALITTIRNPNMESYLHPYYSVYHFRLAYSGVIKPLPDKSQWPHVDLGFKVLPPLSKREVGRQRKNRYPSCLEDKGNKPRGKGAWQVQCKNCFQFGHRTTSPKCPLNGTKKRKSRAKKGKAGRPPGSSKEGASTSKRQRV